MTDYYDGNYVNKARREAAAAERTKILALIEEVRESHVSRIGVTGWNFYDNGYTSALHDLKARIKGLT